MPQNATGTAFDNFQHTEHVIGAIHLMRMDPIGLPFWPNSPATILADMEGLTENERVLHDVLWLRRMLSQPTLVSCLSECLRCAKRLLTLSISLQT